MLNPQTAIGIAADYLMGCPARQFGWAHDALARIVRDAPAYCPEATLERARRLYSSVTRQGDMLRETKGKFDVVRVQREALAIGGFETVESLSYVCGYESGYVSPRAHAVGIVYWEAERVQGRRGAARAHQIETAWRELHELRSYLRSIVGD